MPNQRLHRDADARVSRELLGERSMTKTNDAREKTVTATDPHDVAAIRRMIGYLDNTRRELFELIRTTPTAKLTARPRPGRWSVLEHLRHLVLAEDLYINRWILRNDKPFCALGNLPAFLRGRLGFEIVGTDPTTDVEKILGEWSRIHAETLSFVAGANPLP